VADLAPVTVNCSGIGARTLADDAELVVVRGQIVRTTNPGLTVSVRDDHHPDGYTYVHPRTQDSILGGTLEDDRWDLTPEAGVAEGILLRCQQSVPALAGATVLSHAVGLRRPGRSTVRLETDDTMGPDRMLVHIYGHAGAGVTLSSGCANDVTTLVASGHEDPPLDARE
jgi:D-amino-acid oxidase